MLSLSKGLPRATVGSLAMKRAVLRVAELARAGGIATGISISRIVFLAIVVAIMLATFSAEVAAAEPKPPEMPPKVSQFVKETLDVWGARIKDFVSTPEGKMCPTSPVMTLPAASGRPSWISLPPIGWIGFSPIMHERGTVDFRPFDNQRRCDCPRTLRSGEQCRAG